MSTRYLQVALFSLCQALCMSGDKYFEHGGFSYLIYGGISQEPEVFTTAATSLEIVGLGPLAES